MIFWWFPFLLSFSRGHLIPVITFASFVCLLETIIRIMRSLESTLINKPYKTLGQFNEWKLYCSNNSNSRLLYITHAENVPGGGGGGTPILPYEKVGDARREFLLPNRYDEHPRPFHMGVPPPPRGGKYASLDNLQHLQQAGARTIHLGLQTVQCQINVLSRHQVEKWPLPRTPGLALLRRARGVRETTTWHRTYRSTWARSALCVR